MVTLKHPESGVVVTVAPDLAARLGWPSVNSSGKGAQKPEEKARG